MKDCSNLGPTSHLGPPLAIFDGDADGTVRHPVLYLYVGTERSRHGAGSELALFHWSESDYYCWLIFELTTLGSDYGETEEGGTQQNGTETARYSCTDPGRLRPDE